MAAALAGIAAVTGTLGALGQSFAIIAAFLGIAVPIALSDPVLAYDEPKCREGRVLRSGPRCIGSDPTRSGQGTG
jgi:hypothetical protein